MSNIAVFLGSASVSVAAAGALDGDGSIGDPLTLEVEGTTLAINGSNQVGIKASATLVTPNIGAATGTSVVLSGDAKAATFHVGATAGADGSIVIPTVGTLAFTKGIYTGIS